MLHEKNVILTVHTADQPRIAAEERASSTTLSDSFVAVTLLFGFMERPKVPAALRGLSVEGVAFDAMQTSYFLGRRTIVTGHDHGLRLLQDRLFIALARNSADPSAVFAIPPGRVVEMGVQVSV